MYFVQQYYISRKVCRLINLYLVLKHRDPALPYLPLPISRFLAMSYVFASYDNTQRCRWQAGNIAERGVN